MLKKCNKCGIELPATTEYFYKQKDCKLGLCTYCKKCINQKNIEYYYNNRELLLKKFKEYNQSEKGIEKHRKAGRKYDISEKGKVCKGKYNHSEKGRETRRKNMERHVKTEGFKETRNKYMQSEAGKKTSRKRNAKHRSLGYIEMFLNPFSPEEKIDWHHIIGAYVVAIPRDLHRHNSSKYHREWCMEIVKQIYLE